jgi:transposase
MVNLKIVDASEVKRVPRKAPATRMIEALPDGYLTARQVAERFEVNIETIRRLARAKDAEGQDRFTAPSKAAKSGELIIWVYTPDDIAELAEYFGERGPKVRRKGK